MNTHDIFDFLSKTVGGDISYVVPTELKSGGGDASPLSPTDLRSWYANILGNRSQWSAETM